MIRFSPDLQEVRGEHPSPGVPGVPREPCAHCPRARGQRPPTRHSLGPVRLQQRGVVDDGGQQGGEGPQEEGGEELADDWVLENTAPGGGGWGRVETTTSWGWGFVLLAPQNQRCPWYRGASPLCWLNRQQPLLFVFRVKPNFTYNSGTR